jgi:ribosomal protein RSM22 (predicted rRNA methylase)
MPRYFTAGELEVLRELRETFLAFERPGFEGSGDYWQAEHELALYDTTFARRIGWKWDAVLEELRRRGRMPRGATLLDWGCGTGIATRRTLAALAGVERVFLWDRSRAAAEFAAEQVCAERPSVEVHVGRPDGAPDVLLVSHVLDELDSAVLEELLALATGSGAVLWVEPGSARTSRHLSEVRDRLARELDVLAPCTHQAACGALAGGKGAPWCHFFARAPQEVYTEGRWAEFARELGIDLRALPYSFVVLARRGTFALEGAAARMLGRPKLTRGRAQMVMCDASAVRELDFLQRVDKALFKALEDTAGEPWLFDATVEGTRMVRVARREG